jgi:hypothetical protein
MKEERFKEASELAEQRIRIVRFLCGGGAVMIVERLECKIK